MRRWVIVGGCWLFMTISVLAQSSFRTNELKRLAKSIGVDSATIREGYNYPTVQGCYLVVRMQDNIIHHLGMRLFSADIRQLDDSPVFDFLERYFLQLKFPPPAKTASLMIRDDKFKFEKGDLQTIDRLLPTGKSDAH